MRSEASLGSGSETRYQETRSARSHIGSDIPGVPNCGVFGPLFDLVGEFRIADLANMAPSHRSRGGMRGRRFPRETRTKWEGFPGDRPRGFDDRGSIEIFLKYM